MLKEFIFVIFLVLILLVFIYYSNLKKYITEEFTTNTPETTSLFETTTTTIKKPEKNSIKTGNNNPLSKALDNYFKSLTNLTEDLTNENIKKKNIIVSNYDGVLNIMSPNI